MDEVGTSGIVMLANGHPAFDTRIFIKEARSLVQAGCQVTLILPYEKSDVSDGVSIVAVPLKKKGWQKLLVNPWNILKMALRQPPASIFHIHDSDILLVGIILKLSGRTVIYDAHEDTPLQISYQHWIPGLLKKPYAAFYFLVEKVCGWMFDSIIVAEPVIAKYFPEKKTYLIRNFPIAESFSSRSPVPYRLRKVRLIHIGTLSRTRGLFEMLRAAKVASSTTNFEFFLGGKFAPPGLEKEVIDAYDVTFGNWIAYADMIALLFDSRIGIIIPNPVERYKTNYPVKLFEFMAAALPVIASSEGESATFVKEANCGILVNPLDIEEIARAITWLFNHPDEAEAMGKRGQQLIFEKYNWENESNVLLEVYDRLRKMNH